jgi:chloramphenicol 3-O-phosphotransferase
VSRDEPGGHDPTLRSPAPGDPPQSPRDPGVSPLTGQPMSGDPSPGRVVILSGPLGAGKTATAEAIRARLRAADVDAAVIGTDELYTTIDPRFEIPWPKAGRYMAIVRSLAATIASELIRQGIRWVLIPTNGMHAEYPLDEVTDSLLAENIDVHHITLDPDLAVIHQRLLDRGDDRQPGWIDDHHRWMRDRLFPFSHRIDNGGLTVSETAAAVLSAVEAGRGRVP